MSVTSKVFHEINKIWQAQGDDETAYLTEVKICPTLYDAMVLEGEDAEGKGYILFDPNKFNFISLMVITSTSLFLKTIRWTE